MSLWCSEEKKPNQFEKGSNPHSTTSSITSDIYGPEYHDIRNYWMEACLTEFSSALEQGTTSMILCAAEAHQEPDAQRKRSESPCLGHRHSSEQARG